MTRRYAAAGLILGLTVVFGRPAFAQQAGYQSLSNPAGYQFAVPSAWMVDSSPGAPGMLAGSLDGSQLAYVTVVPPPPAATDELGNEVLQGVSDSAFSAKQSEDGYRITQAASGTTVSGADAAESGAIAYTDANGTQIDGYIVVAVRGLQAYTLTVLLPDADAGSSQLAQAILSSFRLSGASVPGPS